MTKVKICGITNLEDALVSAKFGADALGFNFYPKSPRYIKAEKVREIVEQLPTEILKVGVFVNESLDKIIEIAATAKLDAIQLHGEETPEFAKELKAKTNLEIIKVFRVSDKFKPEDVLQYEVDAILLDAYNPKEHGGTGETFDWDIAKKVQDIFPKMYLAGGLLHENVYRAIYDTKAFAVDICSGIEETKGRKDKIKLINFITKSKKVIQKTPQSLYGLLDVMQLYPTMVVGSKSLTFINRYLSGFESAIKLSESNFNTGKFFVEFDQFVQRKFNEERGALGWNFRILEKVDFDEEKAVDFFFTLLEEFKLEKEGLGKD